MTDLERFKDAYKRIGVELTEVESDGFYTITLNMDNNKNQIKNKFGGFDGFYSVILFEMDGKFMEQLFLN